MDIKRMRAALQGDRPPLELPGFGHSYRRMRIAVNLLIPPSALVLGGQLGGSRAVGPAISLLSLLVLLHSAFFKRASLAANVTFDTMIYVTMGFILDMPEVSLLVAVTQALTVFLHVQPKRAVQLLGLYTTGGVVAALLTLLTESTRRSQGASAFVFIVIAVSTAFPAAWMLSKAAADMLRQREWEETLAAEKDQLLEEKDRFVASVSHELRTPLTAVVGLAHTLVDQVELSDEERRESLGTIVQQSEEVAAIVDDLLVAARAGTGHLRLVVGVVDLRYELITVLPPDFEMDDGDRDAMAIGDPIRVRQILRNLVTNAVRYGGQKRRVSVSRRGALAIVEIRDNGKAIPQQLVDEIFTAYGRAHDRPGRTDSVGLGLTVSRQLARMMGGDVTYSHDGQWACFELALPLSVAELARTICDSPASALAAHGVATTQEVVDRPQRKLAGPGESSVVETVSRPKSDSSTAC